MAKKDLDDDNIDCFVFIDDSNLWIEGQKAQGKILIDANIDPRFRTDLGRFLKTVLTKDGKERNISNAFLYGSIPPPNDTVWSAAKKKNYQVRVFKKSKKGKEKRVDVAMATDMTRISTMIKYSFSESSNETVFIVVTGDKDLLSPIETAIDYGIPVELWAWDSSLACEFRQLANEKELLTVRKLEDIEMTFSFKEFKSTRAVGDTDAAKAIVLRDVPAKKEDYTLIANELCRMLRLFYITCIDLNGKRDLIVEFPNTKPDVVLREIRRLNLQVGSPCSYPEYKSPLAHPEVRIATSNRFEALTELDDSDDTLREIIESSLNLEPEELNQPSTAQDDTDDLKSETSDTWIDVVRNVAGKKTSIQKRRLTPCVFGVHCSAASECHYLHTDQEKKIFRVKPNIKFKYWKAKLCNKREEHLTPDQQEFCSFAHSPNDSWCLKCKKYGHLTDNCKA